MKKNDLPNLILLLRIVGKFLENADVKQSQQRQLNQAKNAFQEIVTIFYGGMSGMTRSKCSGLVPLYPPQL